MTREAAPHNVKRLAVVGVVSLDRTNDLAMRAAVGTNKRAVLECPIHLLPSDSLHRVLVSSIALVLQRLRLPVWPLCSFDVVGSVVVDTSQAISSHPFAPTRLAHAVSGIEVCQRLRLLALAASLHGDSPKDQNGIDESSMGVSGVTLPTLARATTPARFGMNFLMRFCSPNSPLSSTVSSTCRFSPM